MSSGIKKAKDIKKIIKQLHELREASDFSKYLELVQRIDLTSHEFESVYFGCKEDYRSWTVYSRCEKLIEKYSKSLKLEGK